MAESKQETELVECDFHHTEQREKYFTLLGQYMIHPMGGMERGLNSDEQQRLATYMTQHPDVHCFLLRRGSKYVGMSTCYEVFSTFHAMPYLYIHDIFVDAEYRNKGLGFLLIQKLTDWARQHHCCRITLEVRADNQPARHLYAKAGFKDLEPPMSFWTKDLLG